MIFNGLLNVSFHFLFLNIYFYHEFKGKYKHFFSLMSLKKTKILLIFSNTQKITIIVNPPPPLPHFEQKINLSSCLFFFSFNSIQFQFNEKHFFLFVKNIFFRFIFNIKIQVISITFPLKIEKIASSNKTRNHFFHWKREKKRFMHDRFFFFLNEILYFFPIWIRKGIQPNWWTEFHFILKSKPKKKSIFFIIIIHS